MPVMSSVERTFCCSPPWLMAARRWVLPWALSGATLTGDVLEIGGGAGSMAEGFAALQPGTRLTVTDIDPVMVRAAHERIASRGLDVRVTQADVTALPFADASYDVVTSFLMLHHVVDWPHAIAEIARVLRPGGRLVGYDLTRTTLARAVHFVDRSPVRMVGHEELRLAMLAAGLHDVEVRRSAAGHLMRFTGVARS